MQDLPFGQKHLKLRSGELIEVPNVIRLMIPQGMVQQYKQYCMETNFKPFSKSTMLRVLSECSTSVRKSLQGLDNFAAEGTAEGYQRVHISSPSQVADHCPVLALSDSTEVHYQQSCDHGHTDRCDRCQLGLLENLTEIERVLSETKFPSDDEKDEAVLLFQTAKGAILSCKSHILRSTKQDRARLDVLEQLDEKKILIVSDWAMKFLPQRYRESQADWLGKRGICWHISVVYRRLDDVLQWQDIVHIIESCNQESASE